MFLGHTRIATRPRSVGRSVVIVFFSHPRCSAFIVNDENERPTVYTIINIGFVRSVVL